MDANIGSIILLLCTTIHHINAFYEIDSSIIVCTGLDLSIHRPNRYEEHLFFAQVTFQSTVLKHRVSYCSARLVSSRLLIQARMSTVCTCFPVWCSTAASSRSSCTFRCSDARWSLCPLPARRGPRGPNAATSRRPSRCCASKWVLELFLSFSQLESGARDRYTVNYVK